MVSHFTEWFHKILSQSIGLRILWTDSNGFDTSPFHVHLVLGAASSLEWWSSISFDSVWKPVTCEDSVDVLYHNDSSGPGAIGELYFWVCGIFVNHDKQVFPIG